MHSATIMIRGEEHFIKCKFFDDRSTNSFEIEWDWVNQNDRITDLTDEESDAIEDELTKRYIDWTMYGD